MTEAGRKRLAKLLTVHGYRNSNIENIHAEGRLSDVEMKELNKEICNQIYTLLYMVEKDLLPKCMTARYWTSDWDEPILLDDWLTMKQREKELDDTH